MPAAYSTFCNPSDCGYRTRVMSIRLRKLIGTIVLVVFVIVYALFAMSIAATRLPGTSHLVQALYYAVAGLLWVVPAGLLIKWMGRPERPPTDARANQ